ncbi:MAG: TolC family protein [Planctomycetes bacterium]|nr:TolC family protein [Planctomycetota bacterium]
MLKYSQWKILAAAALVAASGCALINPTDPYAGAGITRHGGAKKANEKGVEGPFTLQQCLDIALASNPEIAARAWDTDAAKARKDVATGELLPSVHAVGGYQYYVTPHAVVPISGFGEPGAFSRSIFAGDLVVKMPLFTGGRIISEIKAAELLQQASKHYLARTREELVFNVSSVFYNILARRRIIKSLEFSKKTLEEHRKRVEHLMAVQKAAKVDLLRTEVRLADLEQQLVRERNVVAIQHRVLVNLLGIDDSKKTFSIRGELLFPDVETHLPDALEGAYANRDDYLAARAELEAQAKRVDAARAGRWPTISAEGSYGKRWATRRDNDRLNGSPTQDAGSVGAVVDMPLFEGGRISARIREEKAKLHAAQERLRQLELRVRLDVERAVLNVKSSRARVVATEKAIEQGKESLRIEREKYDLGKGSITDVLDAQSALLDAQTNYYRALAEYNTSIAELRLATGKEQ